MSLSEEEAESKSEISEKSAEQDNAGVKDYNEKFKNLVYTSYSLNWCNSANNIMLDSFHRMWKKSFNYR